VSQQNFEPITLTPRLLTLDIPVPPWLREFDLSKDAMKQHQEAKARRHRALGRMMQDLEARILAPMTGEQQL